MSDSRQSCGACWPVWIAAVLDGDASGPATESAGWRLGDRPIGGEHLESGVVYRVAAIILRLVSSVLLLKVGPA